MNAGLEQIGMNAFSRNDKLESIYIPETVYEIGKEAFKDCRGLVTVHIPASVKVIPEGCFQNCRTLTAVKLSEGLEVIRAHAFAGCQSLNEVVLPETLKTIGMDAFEGCTRLETVYVSGSTKIDKTRFPKKTKFVFLTGVRKTVKHSTAGDGFGKLSREDKEKLAEEFLAGEKPDHYEKVKNYIARTKKQRFIHLLETDDADGLSRLLEYVKIPAVVLQDYIDECLEKNKSNMLSVLLNYKSTGISAKQKDRQAEISLDIRRKTAEEWAKTYRFVTATDGITILKYRGIASDIVIPSVIGGIPVIRIGKNAFKNNKQIISVNIPGTVTTIMEGAFDSCENLEHVFIEDGVKEIQKRAFSKCPKLCDPDIFPDTVEVLGVNIF